MSPSAAALLARVESFQLPAAEIRQQQEAIQQEVLAGSRYIFEANFTAIHPRDLELLFDRCDARFFGGLLRPALNGCPIGFQASPRLTRAGGRTTRQTMRRTGEVSYEIAIASRMLFDSFRDGDREITVCGLKCTNRFEAMQRIFEHELVHLAEMLCWGTSNCSAARFQGIARRMFLHEAHTHDLVTRREQAARAGIRRGTLVSFAIRGVRLVGRVNRITTRATVLVEDPDGLPFNDGKKYQVYYVPIGALEPVATRSGRD